MYAEGYEFGTRCRVREERGWDPGNTYLAVTLVHLDEPEWVEGFEHALEGVPA